MCAMCSLHVCKRSCELRKNNESKGKRSETERKRSCNLCALSRQKQGESIERERQEQKANSVRKTLKIAFCAKILKRYCDAKN